MGYAYFHRLHQETPTRFWVNNPSGADLEQAIAAGAISCTTNPAYCQKLMAGDAAYLRAVIDSTLATETRDIEAAAVRVYQRVSQRVMEAFLPLYRQSGGQCGFVTMQDDPRADHDTAATIRCVLDNRQLGPNYMAKIPVIAGGLEAIEACVRHNVAICATEVFSIAQAIHVCELYEQAVEKTGNRPPFFVTHISGIFDEYLGKVAERERIPIAPDVLDQAGCAVARKEYRLLKERGYQATLLGGGARGTHHFTEMVGGDIHVTINWSTAQEIIDNDTPLVSRMEAEPAQPVLDELAAKFPDFARAYDEAGLQVHEFAGFGPVQLFRNAFLKGWYLLLAEVASRRHAHAL